MNCPPEFSPGRCLELTVLRKWLGACGASAKIFCGCRIISPERLQVGDYAQIDEGVFIFAGEGVVLGNHVHLAFGCSISGGGRCVIGDFAGIGAGARLVTGTDLVNGSGLTNPTVPPEFRAVRRSKIEIGAHAVVFTNSIVLPGVSIGDGAVVAAGSVVHHDLKSWGVYAGNPLVQVGVRDSELVLRMARQLAELQRRQSC